MKGSTLSTSLRYGSALVSVCLATLLCLLLDPLLEGHLYYLWFFLALVLTAWYGGSRPCLLALAVSLPLVIFFFVPPRYEFAIEGSANQVGFLTFCLLGFAVLLYSGKLAEGIQKIAEANAILMQDLPFQLTALRQQLHRRIERGAEIERRLAMQYAMTQLLAESPNLADAARGILPTLCESLAWDVGLFWAVDRDDDVLRCLQVWQRPGVAATSFVEECRRTAFPKGAGLPGRVWESERLVSVTDMGDSDLPRSFLSSHAGLRGAVGFPIRDGDRFLGVMEFFSRTTCSADDNLIEMMAWVGVEISQFIERREAEALVQRQQQQRRTARAIQHSLLPRAVPALAGYDIRGKAIFADEVGGDCFDFVLLPERRETSLAVLLADASGHGIASALLVSETRAYLRALALTGCDVGQMLHLTNQRLTSDLPSDFFVTLFLARLQAGTHALAYASAGHCPGYVLDAGGQIRAVLPSSTLPLGIAESPEPPAAASVLLQPGELVVLYTDGIVEASPTHGKPFGVERLLDIVRVHRREPLDDILDALFQSVADFTHRTSQQDDMTVVLIRAKAN